MPILNKSTTDTLLLRTFTLAILFLFSARASAQFVSYFDYAPDAITHSNATVMPRLTSTVSGVFITNLLNIATGSNTPATLTVGYTNFLPSGQTVGGFPAAGTPAAQVFNGFVDFEGFNIEFQNTPAGVLAHVITGLDPQKAYNFRGTTIRGDPTYTNRWTLFTLAEADSFTNAHTANALTSTQVPANIQTNEAAINTGANHTASTGDLVGWNNIKPGADGRIVIYSRKYNGAVPGGSSAGSKAYGLTGFRLEEISTVITNGVAPRIVAQPATTNFVCRENPLTLTLNATSSPPPSFQWFLDGVAIPGATSSNLVITRAQPVDRGIYTATASNPFGSTNSSNSGLGVSTLDCFDGSAPVLTLRRGQPMSINGAGATSGPPVTASCGSFGRLTKWFRMVSQTNGLATVSTEGSTYDTRLGVFNAPLSAMSTNIACSDDWSSSNLFSRVQFLAQTGAVYFVAVEGPAYQQTLRVTCAIEPLLFTPVRTNGIIQLRSEVAPALSYRLQATSDLLAWSTILSTNLSATGAIVHLDPAFTNTPQRFYKLVPGP